MAAANFHKMLSMAKGGLQASNNGTNNPIATSQSASTLHEAVTGNIAAPIKS
jgi:hypothetical protein